MKLAGELGAMGGWVFVVSQARIGAEYKDFGCWGEA